MFTEHIKIDAKAKTIRIQTIRKQTASGLIPFSYADTVRVKKGVIKNFWHPCYGFKNAALYPLCAFHWSTETDKEVPRH